MSGLVWPGPRFAVLFTSTAIRHLETLPTKVADSVVVYIFGALVVSPSQLGKPLRFELAGLHSARRGQYRIIYAIDVDHLRLVIRAVRHRGIAYLS